MKNISFGIWSCWVAALVWIGACGGIVAVSLNSLYFFKDPSGLLAVDIWFFSGLGMSLLGVGLAIGGLMQADGKKVFAVLGRFFNGLALLGGVGMFCLTR